MKLYHGSLDTVSKPEIREPSRTLDYGKGFYTTTSYEQAESWVKRHRNEGISTIGYVNVYEFDESVLDQYLFHTEQSLKLLSFIEAKEVEL